MVAVSGIFLLALTHYARAYLAYSVVKPCRSDRNSPCIFEIAEC